MTFNKTVLSGMAGLCLLVTASPAALAVEPGTLEIKNFVGRITINTAPDLALDITRQSRAETVSYEDTGKALSIDGNVKRPKSRDCKGLHGNLTWGDDDDEKTIRFGGYKNLSLYPTIVINAPDTITLDIKNSVIFGSAGDVGRVKINDKYCSRFDLGNVKGNASLNLSGSGHFKVKDAGDIKLGLGGSGDVSLNDVGAAKISIGGSGQLNINKSGPAYISLGGSGDAAIGEITGDLEVRAGGSGGIDIGNISGGADITASGSTDIDIGSVNGPLDIRASGSGDVDVDGGQADRVNIRVSGSADVTFGGEVQTADLQASGSGDIYIKSPSGRVKSKSSGSGKIVLD